MRKATPFFVLIVILSACHTDENAKALGEEQKRAEIAQHILSASPNPITSCNQSGLGITTVAWREAPGGYIEVHVDKVDGPLFASSNRPGQSTTGDWVHDGTKFVLRSGNGAVLDEITVHVVCR